MDSVADLIKQAAELKEEGNKLFKEKQWRPALAKYGKIPLYVAHFEVAIPPPVEKEPEVQVEGSKTVLAPETIERIKQMAKEKRAHEARLAGEDVEKAVANMMKPAPKSAAAAPAPVEYTGPVGPNWPTAEQKKQIRELRISAALNSVMCYIRTVDSDPDMAILKPKEAEMKTLMGKALDQINKAIQLDYTNKKAVFRRAMVRVRMGDGESATEDYASIKGLYAMDAEATKELALLEQLKKDQTVRQQKTFSGWLNKVQKRSGGLISDEDLKHERELEAKQKKDKKDWEYKQKEAGGPRGMGFGGGGGGMQMMMVKLKPEFQKKEHIEYITYKWREKFEGNPYEKAIPVQFYPLEGTKLLLSLDGDYLDVFRVKDWVLSQEETEEFEWQQNKYYPKTAEEKKNGGGQPEMSAQALERALRSINAGNHNPPKSKNDSDEEEVDISTPWSRKKPSKPRGDQTDAKAAPPAPAATASGSGGAPPSSAAAAAAPAPKPAGPAQTPAAAAAKAKATSSAVVADPAAFVSGQQII